MVVLAHLGNMAASSPWNREGSAAEPPGLDNPMTHAMEEAAEELEKTLGRVAAIRT